MDGLGSRKESDTAWTPDCIPCTFENCGQGDNKIDGDVIAWSELTVRVVDSKNGKPTFIPFEEATTNYVTKFYPNLLTRTYRIPASLSYPPLIKNSQSNESSKERSDLDCNEEVVRALDAWGKKGKEPMLILVEYKMKSYLKNVKRKTKKAKGSGDHDILVLHKNFGVMFLQLKACERDSSCKNKRDALKKALVQLDRDVKFFLEMNQDLSYAASLRLIKCVALPNLEKSDLSEIGVCESHKTNILTKDSKSTPGNFTKFLESIGFIKYDASGDHVSFSSEQFTEMFGRYAGLASLAQRRPYLRALKDTGLSFNLQLENILLTPQQNALFSAEKRKVILLGDFGSGKSVLITKVAERLANTSDHDVVSTFIISCASVSRTRMPGVITDAKEHFVRFLSTDFITKDLKNVKIKSVKELILCVSQDESETDFQEPIDDETAKTIQLNPEVILKILKTIYHQYGPHKVHVFFDELPFISNWNWHILDSLVDDCPDMYVWFVLASGTYNLQRGHDHAMHMQTLLPRFHVERLQESMRMTQNCYRLYQAMKEYVGIDDSSLTNCGNVVPGPDPLWYPLSECRCSRDNVISFKPIECQCLSERLFRVFEEMWRYHLRGFSLDRICIILGDKHVKSITNFLARHVANALSKLEVAHYPYGGPQSEDVSHPFDGLEKVSIVDHVSIKGCEKFIVIVICPYEAPLIWHSGTGRYGSGFPVCRALANVIFITLSRSERKYFEDKSIEETATSHWNVKGKSFTDTQSQLSESARQYMAGKEIDFFDFLVKKQVLLKCTIDNGSEE